MASQVFTLEGPIKSEEVKKTTHYLRKRQMGVLKYDPKFEEKIGRAQSASSIISLIAPSQFTPKHTAPLLSTRDVLSTMKPSNTLLSMMAGNPGANPYGRKVPNYYRP